MDISTTSIPARTIVGIRDTDTDPGTMFAAVTGELFGFVGQRGLEVTGPLLGVYYHVEDTSFDMAVAVPVAWAPENLGDRFFTEQLGAESAVVGEYIGPYDGLPEAWSDLMASPNIAAGTPTMPCWEEYVTGPESGSGPADWRTTLVQPLA